MLKLNIYVRFALIALTLIGGIILAFAYGFWYAFPFLLAGIILVVGYVLLGTVQSAAEIMQTGSLEEAEKRLNLTFKPDWLYKTNRAYFYMIKGNMAMQRKDTEEGEKWLKKAQSVDIPTDNEKAMIELQLANVAASREKWKQAEIHMRNLKGLKVTEPMLKEQITTFEKAFAQRGQAKAQRRMQMSQRGGFRPGGKRRRPKMR
ncbi:MAG: hypothetical protein AB8G22_15750 [Saprospiraceae bacterium]